MYNKNSNEFVSDENLDLADILFDENNFDPIILKDDNGVGYRFDQIAIIPLEDETFVILQPLDKMDGVSDNEAFVFNIVFDEDDKARLVIVDDNDIGDKVFKEYYRLLDEEVFMDEDDE